MRRCAADARTTGGGIAQCYNSAVVAAGSKTDETKTKGVAGSAADLRAQIRATAEAALQLGALETIESDARVLEDAGVPFSIRVARSPIRKQSASGRRKNPFLPYEEALFVAALGDEHFCLLNKFNVLAEHALIVTRESEAQDSPLGNGDFRALADCLEQLDGLGFYNGGSAAGASQPHKHLQLVPTPLGPGPERVPIERLLGVATLCAAPPAVSRCEALGFRHAIVRVDDLMSDPSDERASGLESRYHDLLADVGCAPPEAYNLLVTRVWMLLVPRRRESSHGVEVNALGVAGALFARDATQLATIESVGPMQLLRDVSFPP